MDIEAKNVLTGDIFPTGPAGKDGYTPIKGVDYWTAEDINLILNYIRTNGCDNNKTIADFTRVSGSHSQAGCLGYTVTDYDYSKKTFTLDDATGLQEAVDKKLSYAATISTNEKGGIYTCFSGTVTKVEDNVVTVSAMPIELKNTTIKEINIFDNDYNIDFEQNSFYIPRLPLAGHRPLGACSSDDGFRCITTAKYGRSTGDTCGVFAQAGDAGCKDCEVWAVGGFARNIGNIANGEAQAVFGKYNALDPNAYFIIGNGTSKANRSNLLKIMKNGSIWLLGNTISDYVVEQGTSGILTYRKWKSGLAECWGRIQIDVTVNTAYGNLYKSETIGRQPFPFTFIEPPMVNTTLDDNASSGFLMAAGANYNGTTTTQTSGYCIVRGIPKDAIASYFVNYDVKGRWK